MSNIVSIVLILASIGLFFGYIDPTYSTIKADQTQKTEYDTALSNSKQLETKRDTLLTKYNQIDRSDLDKLSKLLPDNIDNIRLIIDVDGIASRYGMRIRDFSTDTNIKSDVIGQNTSPYGTLTLSFSTTASYDKFLLFLGDLEKSLRILDITNIGFTPSNTSNLYDYKVTVNTYWLK